MPTTSPLVRNAIKPTWDGSSQGWPRFVKETRNYLVHLDLTHVLPAVAKMTKATFPGTEINVYGPLASGAEAPADDADEEARAAAAARAAARAELDVADLNKVFVVLEEAVPGHVLDDIQAGAGDEVDPVDLWRRFAEHAKGLVVDLSGARATVPSVAKRRKVSLVFGGSVWLGVSFENALGGGVGLLEAPGDGPKSDTCPPRIGGSTAGAPLAPTINVS